MSNEEAIRTKYRLLGPHLKGRLRGLWAAAEAATLGRGGIAAITREHRPGGGRRRDSPWPDAARGRM